MSSRSILWAGAFLALLHSVCFAEVPPPSALRAVQCGALSTATEADTLERRLEAAGFGPIWRSNDEDYVRIYVGRLDRYPDTHLLKNDLRDAGFRDAFEKAFPNTSGAEFSGQFRTPQPRLLFRDPTSQKPFYSPASLLPPEQDPELADLARALRTGDPGSFTAARSKLNRLEDRDPLKGWLMVQLSRGLVLRDFSAEEAFPMLLEVARGEVAATAEDQLEARWLAADSFHYFETNSLKAYEAYNEILREHGSDEGVRARAMTEIAACLLELAQSEKSYYNEVRRAARQLMESVSPEYERAHAVADLLYCESWLYEEDLEQALSEFAGFETRHPNRLREIAMANQMRGWMLAELERWEEAVPWFERNLEIDLPPEESFYWKGERWNLKRLASKWLMHYAGRFEDRERQKRYAEYVDNARYDDGVAPLPADFDSAFPHEFYEWKAR